ncbi:hypothetical protein C2E25_03540 [Geothermobacter hydrogeniphilus]|uniref:Flagellar assembly protein FliH n=1 Tax=Geothermobacter hydrogeniphilus TaxID=1969733 RepID=A0A2K2HCV2_9BACT|nr:flagellar assembly protein FliH [Geothermobacter hydrogeniphilus]PNU21117.1 hypothetical protein C2E25_03540 [Geothermobacter hydrogeniphilus]
MSLSKVHRAQEFANLQQVHFADFGSVSPGMPAGAELGGFEQPAATASSEEAFTRGRQAGIREAEERFEQAANALAKGLEEISRLRESILNNSSRDMLRLVLTIARQVIHREVTVDPEIVLSTIDMALQAAVESDSFQVKVNPKDLALVEERKPLFLASIKGLENIVFKADESIASGGCLVESDLGQVDATIDGQLEEVRKTLLGAIEKS